MHPSSDTRSAVCLSSTVFALRAAAAHVERTLSRVLEPFGVTAAQFELLLVIDRLAESGAGCSELGRHLAVPGPDVTRMLDRLDAAALVSRYRDKGDRRIVHTRLTDQGRVLIAAAGPTVANAEQAVFAGLGEAERQQLLQLLQGVRRNCPGNSDSSGSSGS
ncbi:MarR family transcriptional regulator [Gemmatimonas sp.]|uniref:MarR family winged helix-turn-helix transcriptional regulator n=1 Tax=Gemmatimonas sp. TaxID=1962908 RepID=UPI0025C38313|nr:MarR family transcriptional regulator [Gemmatimonas sp.]MCA2984557.1 MarR family transcriptional regulator [Gemmatimonas sp.]